MRYRLVATLLFLLAAVAAGQRAGGVAPAGSPFKLLRSVSGTKGSEQAGRYHISDPRTTFYVPQDKNVIVYMEWEGPPGDHTFEGLWRNPAGKVTVVTDFKYHTRPREKRYGGYLELMLPDTTQSGIWTMEARIDGEFLATHNFEIIAADRPAIKEDTRQPLGLKEAYERAMAATGNVERYDSKGNLYSVTTGFFLESGAFVTAFQNIDGAAELRVKTVDGQSHPVAGLRAWNRWQDWAVLDVPKSAARALPRAKAGTWDVGERCTTLNFDKGARTIVDAAITGKVNPPRSGEAFKIASSLPPDAIGAPVMNEYGEVIGLVGGVILPGATVNARYGSTYPIPYSTDLARYGSDAAVPISKVPEETHAVTPLSAMHANRQFVSIPQPLVRVLWGAVAKGLKKSTYGMAQPYGERADFRRSDGNVSLFINWAPEAKYKGLGTLKIYDEENRPVGQSKAAKMDFRPGTPIQSTLGFPVTNLPNGAYRVDMELDGTVVWRTYFKMID